MQKYMDECDNVQELQIGLDDYEQIDLNGFINQKLIEEDGNEVEKDMNKQNSIDKIMNVQRLYQNHSDENVSDDMRLLDQVPLEFSQQVLQNMLVERREQNQIMLSQLIDKIRMEQQTQNGRLLMQTMVNYDPNDALKDTY